MTKNHFRKIAQVISSFLLFTLAVFSPVTGWAGQLPSLSMDANMQQEPENARTVSLTEDKAATPSESVQTQQSSMDFLGDASSLGNPSENRSDGPNEAGTERSYTQSELTVHFSDFEEPMVSEELPEENAFLQLFENAEKDLQGASAIKDATATREAFDTLTPMLLPTDDLTVDFKAPVIYEMHSLYTEAGSDFEGVNDAADERGVFTAVQSGALDDFFLQDSEAQISELEGRLGAGTFENLESFTAFFPEADFLQELPKPVLDAINSGTYLKKEALQEFLDKADKIWKEAYPLMLNKGVLPDPFKELFGVDDLKNKKPSELMKIFNGGIEKLRQQAKTDPLAKKKLETAERIVFDFWRVFVETVQKFGGRTPQSMRPEKCIGDKCQEAESSCMGCALSLVILNQMSGVQTVPTGVYIKLKDGTLERHMSLMVWVGEKTYIWDWDAKDLAGTHLLEIDLKNPDTLKKLEKLNYVLDRFIAMPDPAQAWVLPWAHEKTIEAVSKMRGPNGFQEALKIAEEIQKRYPKYSLGLNVAGLSKYISIDDFIKLLKSGPGMFVEELKKLPNEQPMGAMPPKEMTREALLALARQNPNTHMEASKQAEQVGKFEEALEQARKVKEISVARNKLKPEEYKANPVIGIKVKDKEGNLGNGTIDEWIDYLERKIREKNK